MDITSAVPQVPLLVTVIDTGTTIVAGRQDLVNRVTHSSFCFLVTTRLRLFIGLETPVKSPAQCSPAVYATEYQTIWGAQPKKYKNLLLQVTLFILITKAPAI